MKDKLFERKLALELLAKQIRLELKAINKQVEELLRGEYISNLGTLSRKESKKTIVYQPEKLEIKAKKIINKDGRQEETEDDKFNVEKIKSALQAKITLNKQGKKLLYIHDPEMSKIAYSEATEKIVSKINKSLLTSRLDEKLITEILNAVGGKND